MQSAKTLFQSSILCSIKIFLRNKRKIKIFSDEANVREFIVRKATLKIYKVGSLDKKEIRKFKKKKDSKNMTQTIDSLSRRVFL